MLQTYSLCFAFPFHSSLFRKEDHQHSAEGVWALGGDGWLGEGLLLHLQPVVWGSPAGGVPYYVWKGRPPQIKVSVLP